MINRFRYLLVCISLPSRKQLKQASRNRFARPINQIQDSVCTGASDRLTGKRCREFLQIKKPSRISPDRGHGQVYILLPDFKGGRNGKCGISPSCNKPKLDRESRWDMFDSSKQGGCLTASSFIRRAYNSRSIHNGFRHPFKVLISTERIQQFPRWRNLSCHFSKPNSLPKIVTTAQDRNNRRVSVHSRQVQSTDILILIKHRVEKRVIAWVALRLERDSWTPLSPVFDHKTVKARKMPGVPRHKDGIVPQTLFHRLLPLPSSVSKPLFLPKDGATLAPS